MERIFQVVKEGDDDLLMTFVGDVHTLIIEKYFRTYWKPSKFPTTESQRFIDDINAHQANSVLDVGCGYNSFKGKINNLYGIDPYIAPDEADERITLHNYFVNNPGVQHDVILALDSINYGPLPKILHEMNMICDMLAPNGHLYMRLNPGEQLDTNDFGMAELIEVFHWTKEFVYKMADTYGYEVLEFFEETSDKGENRFFLHCHKVL